MRLPPDEYFPSRPQGRTISHENLYRYTPVNTRAPRSSASSSSLSETSGEAGDQDQARRRTSRRSVHFEDQRGFFAKMYTALADRVAPKNKSSLKPAMKNHGTTSAGELPAPEASALLRDLLEPEDKVGAVSKSAITDKDTGKAEDGTSQHASGSGVDSTYGSRPTYQNKGKGKATEASTVERFASASGSAQPTYKGKGKGKAVAVEEAPDNRKNQTDGPAPEEECAIEDSPPPQHAPQSETSATSKSRTPSLELLQDRSALITSGNNCGLLRTESLSRKPPRNAHPKTPDRTFPIQPLPPVQPSLQVEDFKMRHYPHGESSSSQGVPSSSTSFKAARPISIQTQLAAGKALVQRNVKDQLGIDKIPSPTPRPTKTLTDQAVGFLYGDERMLGSTEERDPSEDGDLD